ncbi:hypothetical protein [Sporofaciens sp. SGI.106]|uniref:hypothetical protein n=1 Tax=Sporofaciens sp. SGI.106 TaxID=3420568 RepID=UPI003D08A566
MEEVLNFMNSELETMGVPYEFLEWTQPVSYPYFIGEYNEFEPILENNEEEKTFILTGFGRGKDARMQLERMRGLIEKEFDPVNGKIATLNSGSVVAIFYSSSFYVPTGEEELYKIQINLSVKLWKVV